MLGTKQYARRKPVNHVRRTLMLGAVCLVLINARHGMLGTKIMLGIFSLRISGRGI